jgi:hypothetical protein
MSLSAENELQRVEMASDNSDRDSVAWLAAATGDDPADVAAGLETGARRRVFVVDELLDAGFRDAELQELVIRLTGLDSGQARELIRAREGLLEPAAAPVPQRDRRLAENEVRSRRANEERVRAQTGDSLPVWLEILCECADRDCRQPLTIAAAEYAWLRERRSRFAVLPGHEAPAVEDVVERFPGFVIVEKHVETRLDLEGVDPK